MNLRSLATLVVAIFFTTLALAQTSTQICGSTKATFGKDEDVEKIVVGVKLQWLNTEEGAITNPLGEFCLTKVPSTQMLVVSCIGFATDTVYIDTTKKNIVLLLQPKSKSLVKVTATAQKRTTTIDYLSTSQVLKIKEGELLKAACCNLSESFETTPSVDVSFTDAITGQKQIQMLGLATPHTIITQENIPNIRGLASIIGLNYTPGTWVEGMQLSKGTGSVVNGYEGLAGQINVELKKPDAADEQYYLNLYASNQARLEGNLNLFKQINKHLSGGFLLHHKAQIIAGDNNNDGFRDNQLGNQTAAAYRMQYFSKNGLELQGILKYVGTNENGGTISNDDVNKTWRTNNKVERQEMSFKFGKVFPKKKWKSIGLQLATFRHNQNLNASAKLYQGLHQNYYANIVFQTIIGNTNHGIKFGASYLADNINEQVTAQSLGALNRKEKVPGAYTEHTYNYLDKFTLVSGLRIDAHNLFGTFVTPRVHMRYMPKYGTTIRASIGKARRTVSLLAENQNALYSNRNISFAGNTNTWANGLLPEVAWNMGTSFTQDFKLNYRKGTFVVDYYYTYFTQQWIADYETPREIKFYENKNNSFARALQATADYEIIRKKLDIRIAYKWYDIKNTYSGIQIQKPLQARNRAFINLAYKTTKALSLDFTATHVGVVRLPNSKAAVTDIAFAQQQSSSYFLFNAHASKQFGKKYELYLGGENIGNYMQANAIISAADPLNTNFDATQIWAPIMGANVYVGFRWRGSW
jgi:outer membrane receptor for ferrienterochelin and colicins